MAKMIRTRWIWGVSLAALLLVSVVPPAAACPLSGQAEPVRAKDGVEPPTLIKKVSPVYPEDARKQGIEGTVILEATVDIKGAVQNVKILRSVPALDQAAVDAVKQWVYEPKIIDGKAVPVIFTVTVRFALDKEKKGAVKPGTEGGSPTLIKKVNPTYPEDARKQRIQGSVILELGVDVKGAVQDVKILRSVPALDQAAIDAVKQWVYEPKVVDGKPVPVTFTVTVRFVLDDKGKKDQK